MKYPKPLRPGDTIGICAPSSGVLEPKFARLDNARRNVASLGFQTIETASVRQNAKCVSADAKTRATELMSLYENADVAAIIPPWGGEFLMDMLPYLDFARLSECPPKWIAGYSDTTTLTFPLTLLADMATIHGTNFMNLGFREIHASDLALFEAMSNPTIAQHSADCFGSFTSFSDIDCAPYTLNRNSRWKSLSGENAHVFEGRMIGGCMDVLAKLIGTRFAPVAEHIEKYSADGFIWALESCEMGAADIYRTLWQMRQCGWFRHCNGILMGRPDGYRDQHDFTLVDALRQSFDGLHAPVLYDADIGHIPPQMQIINGAYGQVRYADGKATVYQEQRP